MKIQSLFVFQKGKDISPFCLLFAQTPLGGTVITRIYHYKGAMYMLIEHNAAAQIEGYIKRVTDTGFVNVEKKSPQEDIDIYHVKENV